MPDEFTDAYREAYERALRDQTDAARHRRPPQYRPGYVDPTTRPEARPLPVEPVEPAPFETVAERPPQGPPAHTPDIDLPQRRGRLITGTHRVEDPGGSWSDRARDSRWFVPVLLVTLALLLVLGAYVLGRIFTAAVGSA